jgi:hypothetical protein
LSSLNRSKRRLGSARFGRRLGLSVTRARHILNGCTRKPVRFPTQIPPGAIGAQSATAMLKDSTSFNWRTQFTGSAARRLTAENFSPTHKPKTGRRSDGYRNRERDRSASSPGITVINATPAPGLQTQEELPSVSRCLKVFRRRRNTRAPQRWVGFQDRPQGARSNMKSW